jgi:hypothetical protein
MGTDFVLLEKWIKSFIKINFCKKALLQITSDGTPTGIHSIWALVR